MSQRVLDSVPSGENASIRARASRPSDIDSARLWLVPRALDRTTLLGTAAWRFFLFDQPLRDIGSSGKFIRIDSLELRFAGDFRPRFRPIVVARAQ